jgi:rubrerythrin
MNQPTRLQTETLFLEVSVAASRNKIYALRAAKEGDKQPAKLFSAIALSKEAQAQRLLLQLRGQTGTSQENTRRAFTVEIPSLLTQYETAAKIAEQAKERGMYTTFSQSARVERMHIQLQKKLDASSSKACSYHICSFCGFIMENRTPEKCPICTASAHRFKTL